MAAKKKPKKNAAKAKAKKAPKAKLKARKARKAAIQSQPQLIQWGLAQVEKISRFMKFD